MQRAALFSQVLGVILRVHNTNLLQSESYSCLQKLKDFDISEN